MNFTETNSLFHFHINYLSTETLLTLRLTEGMNIQFENIEQSLPAELQDAHQHTTPALI